MTFAQIVKDMRSEKMPVDEEYRLNHDIPLKTCSCSNEGCTANAYQYADVSVPVQLESSTSVGDIEVECYGEPIVRCCENECGNGLEVNITQKLSIKIPIYYEITACAKGSFISCGNDV